MLRNKSRFFLVALIGLLGFQIDVFAMQQDKKIKETIEQYRKFMSWRQKQEALDIVDSDFSFFRQMFPRFSCVQLRQVFRKKLEDLRNSIKISGHVDSDRVDDIKKTRDLLLFIHNSNFFEQLIFWFRDTIELNEQETFLTCIDKKEKAAHSNVESYVSYRVLLHPDKFRGEARKLMTSIFSDLNSTDEIAEKPLQKIMDAIDEPVAMFIAPLINNKILSLANKAFPWLFAFDDDKQYIATIDEKIKSTVSSCEEMEKQIEQVEQIGIRLQKKLETKKEMIVQKRRFNAEQLAAVLQEN